VRTEKKLQAVDSWCAWRTLQTWLTLNAMILRHIRASLTNKTIIPAQAGIQENNQTLHIWLPACAGMTALVIIIERSRPGQ
jgi:hypothetical protein